MKQIIILTDPNGDDVYLPLEENLKRGDFQSFQDLKNSWESLKWGYFNYVTVRLGTAYTANQAKELKKQLSLFPELPEPEPLVIDINNYNDTVICNETDVVCFKELTCMPDFYATPYDTEPMDLYFMSVWAEDCYSGYEYSKDFAYKRCPDCGRMICE